LKEIAKLAKDANSFWDINSLWRLLENLVSFQTPSTTSQIDPQPFKFIASLKSQSQGLVTSTLHRFACKSSIPHKIDTSNSPYNENTPITQCHPDKLHTLNQANFPVDFVSGKFHNFSSSPVMSSIRLFQSAAGEVSINCS
jgi:hypothetical protein